MSLEIKHRAVLADYRPRAGENIKNVSVMRI